MAIDFRQIILNRLATLRKSRYWLAERVGDVTISTEVCVERGTGGVMHAAHVARILDALDLRVTSAPKK